LYDSFEEGRVLKEGVRTAILGKPNVGKSSLMNTLLKEERAIVTDIPGTTRDTIEEFVNIRGIPLRIIDTAGIRKTDDKIEEIGVEKAKKEIKDADMIIAVFDISRELTEEDFEIIELIKNKKAIVIINKIDLETKWSSKEFFSDRKILDISARTKVGIEELENEIEKLWKNNDMPTNEDIIGDTPVNSLISINNATLEELMTLSGIGKTKAESIIKYRNENGGFKTLEELKNVKGIGDSTFEKIKANITL